ncbi:MAG: phospholipid-binding lipoprotein MlaA [Alphaproteobacteria bacterium]|jgi:phospholipid-binding lipoprotein MlaA
MEKFSLNYSVLGINSLSVLSRKVMLLSTLLFVLVSAGCASNTNVEAQADLSKNVGNTFAKTSAVPVDNPEIPADNPAESAVWDPLEPFNRVMWDFNYEILDRFLVKPLTIGYVAVTPQPIRTGLLNAARNIEEPVYFLNNLLQGKGGDSVTSVARFAINSTVGILGVFDVAGAMGLERKNESFGEVLGVWGVGTGPYLMLPALGPSSIRSFTGRVADGYVWPNTVIESPYLIAATAIVVVEARASLLNQEETLKRSIDPYLFVRDAYFQRLEFKVKDGVIEQKSEDELEKEQDDFSDFEDLLYGN